MVERLPREIRVKFEDGSLDVFDLDGESYAGKIEYKNSASTEWRRAKYLADARSVPVLLPWIPLYTLKKIHVYPE